VERAITPQTRAILPVHLYGLMSDMRALRALADRHGLALLEDAAHALESARDGVRPGELSDAVCLSFYATKSITSGEGGALCTNSSALNDLVRRHRQHGMDLTAADRYTGRFRHYDVTVCGWKYNMDNIQAALLLPQLARIEASRARREAICLRYAQAFEQAGIPFIGSIAGAVHAHHLFTILTPAARRDAMLWALQERGIGVAVNYRPIHLLAHYRSTFGYEAGAFPVAENIGNRTITLPVYPKLTDGEVERVIEAVIAVAG
jgi:dTDP-4-amino-4,6-dideoxygalactose transaminase